MSLIFSQYNDTIYIFLLLFSYQEALLVPETTENLGYIEDIPARILIVNDGSLH